MPPVSAATLGGAPPAWLRGPSFDLALIVGVLALALVMGGLACASPELFLSVLLVDLWLLAYPHVASTFTRIAFTREDVRRRWFLLFALPPLVLPLRQLRPPLLLRREPLRVPLEVQPPADAPVVDGLRQVEPVGQRAAERRAVREAELREVAAPLDLHL